MERCEHYTLDCEQEKMGCRGCAYNKKSADELFEKLGYKKSYSVTNDEVLMIGYGLNGKSIEECEIIFVKKPKKMIIGITIGMQELQAINKKVEELRMEVITRLIICGLIIFIGGFSIGMLIGLFIGERKEN